MTVAARPTAGTLQERVTAIVAAVLRVPPVWIAPSASFASLGMDSLGAVELTAAIEDELAVRLPATAAYDFPTIESLCRFLESGVNELPDARATMFADALLPSDIQPPAGNATPAIEARRVLLTGATGFLGVYLLRALLDETNATIHCLVRSRQGGSDAKARLFHHLAEEGLAHSGIDGRLEIIEADLAKPLLGLTRSAFDALAMRIDAIYHCGAVVNWVYGYDELRDANVFGTRELLRLAAAGRTKPFHFISSSSVCHSTSGPAVADESLDAFAGLDGLHFGYAQSKAVAEALVRQAARRGLPSTIVRPSLVTGDSRTGRSNVDDLTSRLVAGCIRMGSAPDLDWRMDCVPVDGVARAIVRLTRAHDDGLSVAHLISARPRHWSECILWMRLAGYAIQLVPYREWLEQLRTSIDRDHPLFPLRAFFLATVRGEGGLTLPELFEESRRPRVVAERTRAAMRARGASIGDVDLEMLARYFDDYVTRGTIPDATHRVRRHASSTTAALDFRELQTGLSRHVGSDVRLERVDVASVSSEDSIIAELTGWRGGSGAGLSRGRVSCVDEAGVRREQGIFVKRKAPDEQSIEVAEALGALVSPSLGDAITAFRDRLGLTRSHLRELAVYADDDPRVVAHRPAALAIERDDANAHWVVVMEAIDDAVLVNALSPAAWTDDAIDAALSGLAQLHARWYGLATTPPALEWLPPIPSADSRCQMSPLWRALATHAASQPAWRDGELRSTHEALVRNVASWARVLDECPRTLIHNDFNPRNIAIRRRNAETKLCALDWELATIGAPQRDLAEFLCFVLPANAPHGTAQRWIERSRELLAAATGEELDAGSWLRGFCASLCDLLVDRLAMLALIDRVRPQAFLPRVVRSWMNLYRHVS